MLAALCSCSGGEAASVWRLPGAAPIEDRDLEFSEPTESARCRDLNPCGLCAIFCTASARTSYPLLSFMHSALRLGHPHRHFLCQDTQALTARINLNCHLESSTKCSERHRRCPRLRSYCS